MFLLLVGHSLLFTMLRVMAAVAEWLICRFAAAAESDAIANFVCFSVCRFDWNAAAHPDWTAAAHLGIFDQSDGFFKVGLECLFGFCVPDYQTAGRAIA